MARCSHLGLTVPHSHLGGIDAQAEFLRLGNSLSFPIEWMVSSRRVPRESGDEVLPCRLDRSRKAGHVISHDPWIHISIDRDPTVGFLPWRL